LTATGLAIGSPHYVSPEQASGKAATPRSDVYSLGIVLYELLTGQPPFDADNATAIAIAHVEQQPDAPSARVPGIPVEIDNLVLRCLAKDPNERFEDGFALAAALDAPESVVAVPATVAIADEDATGYWAESPSLFKRVAAGFGVLAVLVAGAAAMVWASTSDSAPRALSQDVEVHDGNVIPRDRQRPSPTATASTVVSSVASPSPSPTPTTADEDKPERKRDPEPTVTVVSDDPKNEPSPEPTPEPTTEPTTEPTPQPTGEAPPP
jgi:serine/threonine-protein kinase